MSNLFQEKQAELQSAVLRVDQVSWTLLVKLKFKRLPRFFTLFSPVDPAVGGFEERTSSVPYRSGDNNWIC